jgi:hypothetical protein
VRQRRYFSASSFAECRVWDRSKGRSHRSSPVFSIDFHDRNAETNRIELTKLRARGQFRKLTLPRVLFLGRIEYFDSWHSALWQLAL